MIPARPRRLALLSVLLVGPSPWLGLESRPLLARADSVDDKIDGKWQEFWFGVGPNQEAYPCTSGCSEDTDSEGLGENNPPWTVKSSTSCLRLDVIEGYGGGEAMFEVFNNDDSLGNTTDVPYDQGSGSCFFDPTACYFDIGVTKGEFVLQKSVQYNLRIIARRSDRGDVDGGWFRLKSVGCDGDAPQTPVQTPVQSPVKEPVKKPTKQPARSPTKAPVKAAAKQPTKQPRRSPVGVQPTSRSFSPASAASCGAAKARCGAGRKKCCEGLVCGRRRRRRSNTSSNDDGGRTCRRKGNKNGGNGNGGGGGDGVVTGPMGIGVPGSGGGGGGSSALGTQGEGGGSANGGNANGSGDGGGGDVVAGPMGLGVPGSKCAGALDRCDGAGTEDAACCDEDRVCRRARSDGSRRCRTCAKAGEFCARGADCCSASCRDGGTCAANAKSSG